MKDIFNYRKTLNAALAVVFMLQFTACTNFLNVQPRDYLFEDEAFSTEKGVESVLNGVYQSLSNPQSYGDQLTINLTEQIGQYYYAQGFASQAYLKDFKYDQTKAIYSNVWRQAFQNILNVNNFCQKVNQPGFNVLPADKQKIMLGEAYAVRAYLHFDMLRLFGPLYAKAPQEKSIPYVVAASPMTQPILPASEVIDKILLDLDTALTLLDKDPVRTTGPNRIAKSESNVAIDYMSNRHRRFNYFAVKTFAARVLLYAGKKEKAWEMVSGILEAQEHFFPWMTESQIASDPLMSKESFFGIENKELYNIYRDRFSAVLQDNEIYYVNALRLGQIYNLTSTDLRLKYWFKDGIEGNKPYKVLVKQSDATVKDVTLKYYQPLIRKSELYLIAAETAPDLAQGYAYLNKHRITKGIPGVAVGNSATLLTEIRNEYQREFIGEGQTFFMFKRFNLSSLPSVTGSGSVFMTDAMYVPPLPEDERFYR